MMPELFCLTLNSTERAQRLKTYRGDAIRAALPYGLVALLASASVKFLVAGGFVGFWNTATAQSEPWQFEYVHAPRQFSDMRDRSLRFDADGHPHIVYGKDGLYHAWSNGTSWHYETVDSSPHVGTHAALAIDENGGIHVSYYDDANQALKYAYGESQVWHTEIVDKTDWAGAYCYSSIGVDDAGRVHISYHGGLGENLKYALKEQSGWTVVILDSPSSGTGSHTSLCLDSGGFPHISYFGGQALKYAFQNASGWHLRVVDSEGYVGQYTSLCLDDSDHPHISYHNATDHQLKYAYHNGTVWHFERADGDLGSGKYTSIALDSSGNPYISHCREWYGEGGLKYTFKDGDGWHSELVDPGDKVGRFSSIVLDGSGSPGISYRDIKEYELKYAGKAGIDWEIHVVDQGGVAGRFVSLVLDSARKPHASYEWSPYEWQVPGRLIYGWMDELGWHAEEADVGGRYTSIALDMNANPRISHGHNYVSSYPPYLHGDLNYAYEDASNWTSDIVTGESFCLRTAIALNESCWPHIACGLEYADDIISWGFIKYAYKDEAGWHIQTLEDSESIGGPSLVLDAEGQPHVIYSSDGSLKCAHYDSMEWVVDVIDESDGRFTALTIDDNGCFHLSYCCESDLKYAIGDSSGWEVEVVDESTDVSYATSLSLDGFGQPHIAYYDNENEDLRYAFKDSDGWHTALVDSSGMVGLYLSLAIDDEGGRHILYFDETRGDLKYAHRVGTIQMKLTGDVIGSDLQLSWTEVLSADSYWVYGAANYQYFLPGPAPGFEHRIDVVPQGTTVWVSPYPVGDPMSNWTYLVSAVDDLETELSRSNRVGEFDVEINIPD
jgi:hypothetical protein